MPGCLDRTLLGGLGPRGECRTAGTELGVASGVDPRGESACERELGELQRLEGAHVGARDGQRIVVPADEIDDLLREPP
jgi:hypothetical protein